MNDKIKLDFPLANRFIKKGKEITENDICYLSSNTGELVNHISFFSSIKMFLYDDILRRCALQDIEKYTPLTKEMFTSCKEIKIAENLKKIETEQKESMKKRPTENEKEQEKLDVLKETNDNIWL